MASSILRVYHWDSWSLNLTWSQRGTCPVAGCCLIVWVSEVLRRTVVGSDDWLFDNPRGNHHQSPVLFHRRILNEPNISFCSLILSSIALSVSPMYTLPHSELNLINSPSCFADWMGSLGRTYCHLIVVSDLRTLHTPCCCREQEPLRNL